MRRDGKDNEIIKCQHSDSDWICTLLMYDASDSIVWTQSSHATRLDCPVVIFKNASDSGGEP